MARRDAKEIRMRRWHIRRPSPSMLVAVLALFVALGGTVYAASSINGKTIKKNSLPGNRIKKKTATGDRLKNNTITGTQVNESSLGKVPTAALADKATTADTATTALSANPPAYAHILPNGSVDSGDALNISNANVSHPEEGVYCLSGLSVKPHVVLTEVDSGDGPGVTESSVLMSNFIVCPPSANAEIVTFTPDTIEFKDYGGGLYVVVF
jgi:hypothetical protein